MNSLAVKASVSTLFDRLVTLERLHQCSRKSEKEQLESAGDSFRIIHPPSSNPGGVREDCQGETFMNISHFSLYFKCLALDY